MTEKSASEERKLKETIKTPPTDNSSAKVAPHLEFIDPHCAGEEQKLSQGLKSLKMVVEHKKVNETESQSEKDSMESSNPVGKNLRLVLEKAQAESRVVVGLSAAIKHLSVAPEESLFCVLAPPKKGDSATHMHEVLLQAFCFENDIYIIQVRLRQRNVPSTEIGLSKVELNELTHLLSSYLSRWTMLRNWVVC